MARWHVIPAALALSALSCAPAEPDPIPVACQADGGCAVGACFKGWCVEPVLSIDVSPSSGVPFGKRLDVRVTCQVVPINFAPPVELFFDDAPVTVRRGNDLTDGVSLFFVTLTDVPPGTHTLRARAPLDQVWISAEPYTFVVPPS